MKGRARHGAGLAVLKPKLVAVGVQPRGTAVIGTVKEAGLNTNVIVGGAPVTKAFCDKIGADGYAGDAASAADLARRLIGGSPVPGIHAPAQSTDPRMKP
jgi:5-methyltetrahydrofolate--homocysteine methyltransferase